MQTAGKNKDGQKKVGTFGMLTQIIKKEGLGGLYRGVRYVSNPDMHALEICLVI